MRPFRASRRNHTRASEGEFWRHRPDVGHDPQALRGFGATATAQQDGPSMMAAGWELTMSAVPLDEGFTLLRAGFERWRATPGYESRLGRRFLEQLLAELMDEPAGPDELWSLPPGVGGDDPIAAHYMMRCWVASELLDLGVEPVMERWLYGIVTRSAAAFVPPVSMNWAVDYAQRHDLPAPWV